MPKDIYIVRAPGKLSLLGEYAVLEEGIPAVVSAVNKYIFCQISLLHEDKIIFKSKRIGIDRIFYQYREHKLHLLSENENIDVIKYSQNAIELTLRCLEEIGTPLKNFEINILSDLSNRYGVKYGFGSSAAVTVSIVAAILCLHGYEINKQANRERIFKLSAISHFLTQGSGSGLDVAASTFGGMFIYKSFTSDWMQRRLKKMDLVADMVAEPWKFFYYEKIQYLFDLFLCVGWTGKAASTGYFLAQVKNKVKYADNEDNLRFYTDFIKASSKVVEMFVHGIDTINWKLIYKAINANRNMLLELAKRANVTMETEPLKYLIAIAKKLGHEAKFSGAGGGDCGFTLCQKKEAVKLIGTAWKKYDIEPVELDVEEMGVCEVDFVIEKNTRTEKRSLR